MALDNFRTIELIWDKANKSIIKTIKTASSDTTGRYFSVKVLDDGQEVDLTGAKLQLYWEHPNFNTNGTDDFTMVDNKGLFKLTFSDEMLTNVGELNAHLVLTLSDGKITSDGFPIVVFKGADEGVVVPTNGNRLIKQIDNKINKGQVTMSDLTQEVKEALTGGAVAVVGVDAVGTENVKNGAITDSKISSKTNLILKKPGKNILDENNIVADDYYVNYAAGNLKEGVGNHVVSVPVEENTEYTLSNRSVINASLQQLAFYNSDGVYISGISNSGVRIKATYTTPIGATEMKLTVNKTQKGKIQFEKGSFMTAYEPYVLKLPNDVIDNKYTNYLENATKNILTVKADGSGDFTELRLALESTADASENNQYEVHIEEGTYDVRTMYSQSEFENVSFKGLTIPNYVSLIGMGKKENTIITLSIPESYAEGTIMRVATIANMGNGDLKNLTVIGSNVRYTIHDDYAYPDAVKNTYNCTFIKKNSLGNSQAWGEGTGSGMEFYFEDVEFITEHNQASYSTHNNLAHEKPTKHVFKNCKFKNNGGYYGVRFITLDSGQTEKVDMIDCYVDGVVKFEEHEQGVGCRYDFNMYGMSDIKVAIDATDGSQPVYLSNLETLRGYNVEATATITKGTPVMFNNDGRMLLRLGDNDPSLIVGIAMEDILPSEVGIIKTRGYLPVSDTGLTLVKGDKVGVVSGALAKVTTGDYVAIANQRDFVKLKF